MTCLLEITVVRDGDTTETALGIKGDLLAQVIVTDEGWSRLPVVSPRIQLSLTSLTVFKEFI